MTKWDELASEQIVKETTTALDKKGYKVIIVESRKEALEKIKELIPMGASVMNGSSVTLEQIGYMNYLKTAKHGWNNLHAKINSENDAKIRAELRRQGILADYYLGSVHALTVNGEFIIASNTGSQLPHLAFTSPNLILVIGTQKIVNDFNQGMKRLTEYVVPLEDKRIRDLYGVPTNLSKILFFKAENKASTRKINCILVKEKLGF